jgi:hypothetical protein
MEIAFVFFWHGGSAAVLVGEYRHEAYRLKMSSLDGIDSAISDFFR